VLLLGLPLGGVPGHVVGVASVLGEVLLVGLDLGAAVCCVRACHQANSFGGVCACGVTLFGGVGAGSLSALDGLGHTGGVAGHVHTEPRLATRQVGRVRPRPVFG
jgi:hypothetical protein